MTRRVHGSSAVALNEVSRATFVFRSTFLFLPSFAGLIVAPKRLPSRDRSWDLPTNAITPKVRRIIPDFVSASSTEAEREIVFFLSRYWYESVRIGVEFKWIQGGMENFMKNVKYG